MTPRARPDQQQHARSRRRARWTMRLVTGMCVLLGLTLGATQLMSNGFGTFVDRPAGVGASEGQEGDEAANQVAQAARQPQADLNNQPDAPRERPPLNDDGFRPPRDDGGPPPDFGPPRHRHRHHRDDDLDRR